LKRKLILLLSEGYGIKNWENLGTLDRELKIYKDLAKQNERELVIISYNKDFLDGINIMRIPFSFINHKFINIRQFCFLFTALFKIKTTDIIITNQAHNGGWLAVLVKMLVGCKVIARCGYVFGEQMEYLKMKGFSYSRRRFLEKITMKYSNIIFCPTVELKDWINTKYGLVNSKIKVVPNFVDENNFSKKEKVIKNFDAIYVGRIHDEKRVYLVNNLVKKFNLRTCIIGKGKDESVQQLKNLDLINYVPSVPNKDLNDYLCQSKYFVTGSSWEGHPKAIIEAMACGLICIAPSVNGINNLIEHGKTGILYDGSTEDLITKFSEIDSNINLQQLISNKAEEFISKNLSYSKVLKKVNNYIKSL
jgi:glycosyltransferase involved in cell wall biosynthesis